MSFVNDWCNGKWIYPTVLSICIYMVINVAIIIVPRFFLSVNFTCIFVENILWHEKFVQIKNKKIWYTYICVLIQYIKLYLKITFQFLFDLKNHWFCKRIYYSCIIFFINAKMSVVSLRSTCVNEQGSNYLRSKLGER